MSYRLIKYLQATYKTKDLYLEYIKNIQKSKKKKKRKKKFT